MKAVTFLLFWLAVSAQTSAQQSPPPGALAITHVTVIDGTGAKPTHDQTIVITGNRITALGKTGKLKLPTGARSVDATGQFMIPGLWDMHVHLGSEARFFLPLFIANGVTGIRIMAGLPEHRLWRREVEAGTVIGPRMVIASPIIDGPHSYVTDVVVANAAEARAAVRKARQDGADFIKIHDLLTRDAYFAIMDEARKQRLPVEGHIPRSITPEEASDAGQATVEHLTRLDNVSFTDTGRGKAVALLARFKKNHTWQCPTLVMTRNYAWLDDPALTSDPRLKYVRPGQADYWRKLKDTPLPAQEWAERKQIFRHKQALVREMQRAGVEILTGTDLGNPFCFPGFSLHDELALFVEAGMTPMEALQAATRHPARFLHADKEWGTIQRGKRADLVLIDGDPLADIRNTQKIHAVVANGRFYDRAQLDRMLAEAIAAAAKER